MAARIGMTLAALRKLDPAACDTDARLVWKDGDNLNISVAVMCTPEPKLIQGIHVSSARELRLLGAQMMHWADVIERDDSNEFEIIA